MSKLTNLDSELLNEYDGIPEGWELVATVDESDDYEVDRAEVWKIPTGYALLTAEGCSCWAGEYVQDNYENIGQLALGLFSADRTYNPTVMGAVRLFKEVLENTDDDSV